MPKVIKPEHPFTNVCWVSVFSTFSAPPQILAASTVFFCPIPENEEMMVMVLVLVIRFVLNSKRLLSTSCNKQGQRSSEVFSTCVIPDAFEVRKNQRCRKLNNPATMS